MTPTIATTCVYHARLHTITGKSTAGPNTDQTFTYTYLTNSANLLDTITGPAHTATDFWEKRKEIATSSTKKPTP